MVRWMLAVLCCGSLAASFACSDDERDVRGEAALATAQFWQQEASAGVLPEGTDVAEGRTALNGVILLQSEEGTQARVCVAYEYVRSVPPFELHTRVYVASLTEEDTWRIEVVNPDGTCEGVV